MTQRRRLRGFSLVEIIMVLSIATIILAVGIPAYVRGDRRQQAKAAADQLVSALRLARSQAMTNGDGVGFRDVLPQAVADGRYALYAVRQGMLDRTPVLQGDTTFTPSGVPVLQVGGGPTVGGTQGTVGMSEGGRAAQGITVDGKTIGSVLVVQGQPIMFNQDGSSVQAAARNINFDFGNGYGNWRVTLSPNGQTAMTEIAAP